MIDLKTQNPNLSVCAPPSRVYVDGVLLRRRCARTAAPALVAAPNAQRNYYDGEDGQHHQRIAYAHLKEEGWGGVRDEREEGLRYGDS